jgi:DNA repair protein SbcC/Rad50
MITSISIENFQSHSDSVLYLDPGVNLICGSSDSGKSSIIRALKWAAVNRPSGDSYRSYSGGDTKVTINFKDGSFVSRHRDKKVNGYQTGGGSWEALGNVVPETVSQLLNISELSWQFQMDPPFLLSSSPGDVARTLNEVADLDKIDSTLVNINRMARDNRQQLTETAAKKQQLGIELSQYRGLDKQLGAITLLKEQDRKAHALEELVTEGEALCIDTTHAQTKLLSYTSVERWFSLVHQLNELENQKDVLELQIEKGEALLETAEQLHYRLTKVKDTTDAEEELDLLMDMVGKVKDCDFQADKMEGLLSIIVRTQTRFDSAAIQLTQLEKRWKTEFPNTCPLCGRSK